MNYPIVVAVIVLAVALIVFLVAKNLKDERKFEQDTIDAELPPEKDDQENT